MRGPAGAAGYAVERERGAIVVALPSVMQEVLSHIRTRGTLYEAAASRDRAQAFAGRGAAYRMTMSDGDWLVRHYRRGGLIARLLDDEYLRGGESRPLRELRASALARSRGIDTPEVLAGIVYSAGIFYRADLATRFVPDSRDLAATVFGSDGGASESGRSPAERFGEPVREAVWHAAGLLLRAAFAAGVEHADLNLRNILITGAPSAPRALLLDLDRATVHDRAVSDAVRSSMVERLHRSRRKLESAADMHTSAAELAAFEAGLEGAEP